ncbi:MAG: N-acetylmuramoyl-L-alanine amidase [Burkholderiaceae bacterium]
MAFALSWMPAVLLEAGLKVAEVDGWQSRGRAQVRQTLGVMIHHTACPHAGNMPSLRTLLDGRSDLSGPLSQLGLGRDGTWYIIAAGRANHAGEGNWRGIVDGNAHFIGIECENAGGAGDSWPDVQMSALRQGVAALLQHLDRDANWCMGHREYAPSRKPDPLWDLDHFRREVAALLTEGVAALPLIPAIEPVVPDGAIARPTLRRGSGGDWVKHLQRALNLLPVDGLFGPRTEAAVRRLQRDRALVPDGIVGPKTWADLPPDART